MKDIKYSFIGFIIMVTLIDTFFFGGLIKTSITEEGTRIYHVSIAIPLIVIIAIYYVIKRIFGK